MSNWREKSYLNTWSPRQTSFELQHGTADLIPDARMSLMVVRNRSYRATIPAESRACGSGGSGGSRLDGGCRLDGLCPGVAAAEAGHEGGFGGGGFDHLVAAGVHFEEYG